MHTRVGLAKTIYMAKAIHIYITCVCLVYTRYFWQENHQVYDHIWCIYTVLANPTLFLFSSLLFSPLFFPHMG